MTAPGVVAMLLQAQPPQNMMDMLLGGTWATRVVLIVLALFSIVSLWVILSKSRHFAAVRQHGDRFLAQMEQTTRLEDAYRATLPLPDSPYTRVFKQGVTFFSELRPGALRKEPQMSEGLSLTQLEALRLVMEKVEAEEMDEISHGLTWLAIIGSISPLLGLMGTVMGIMNTFLGITATGSTNIGAVAPGVADALVTTVAGLAVAIPSVMAYNHFAAQVGLIRGELEGFSSEFIGTLAREGRV
ncbi:MAG: MotA/TolQ/ExbB proton channel family protein [Longimicrobiales bacterium]